MMGILNMPQIKNGSKIEVGKEVGKITIITDRHFNWFQKKMIEWCFGFMVSDYSEVK